MTLWSVLLAPDPETADHPALALCGAIFAAVALVLMLWREAPRAVLHAICPAGTLAATAAVALAEPIGLTPCFYLWPMIVAAYAATVADKLRRRLAAPTPGQRPLTVSFGVADVADGAISARAMFDDADRALYAAKRAGRDRVMRSDELPAAA